MISLPLNPIVSCVLTTTFALSTFAGLLTATGALAADELSSWETAYPNEERDAKTQAAELVSQIQNDYINKDKRAFRDAHPRGIGCVNARFTIDPNLPSQYRIGVFATPGKSYESLIRFSSATGPAGDNAKDARGMAVKLFGVPGKKLAVDQPDATTHDFVMFNAVFPARNANEFAGLVHIKTDPGSSGKFLLGNPILRARELKALWNMTGGNPYNGSSLTEMSFSSAVPYLLKGPSFESPVKFSARPCATPAKLPLDGGESELRNDLQARLNKGEVCYEFAMQFYRENAGLEIEDAMNEWTVAKTPYVKFATITIPTQTFLTDEKLRYCDNLSMSPFHAIAEHRPIGNVNRSRKIIYEILSDFRHKQNGENQSRGEPKTIDTWKGFKSTAYATWDAVLVPAPSGR